MANNEIIEPGLEPMQEQKSWQELYQELAQKYHNMEMDNVYLRGKVESLELAMRCNTSNGHQVDMTALYSRKA